MNQLHQEIAEQTLDHLVDEVTPIVASHYDEINHFYADFDAFVDAMTEELKRDRIVRNKERIQEDEY